MKFFLIFIFCAMTLWIGWRFASLRRSIPCPSWLSWLIEKDNPFAKVNRAAAIIENSDILKGMTVLDAGCGPGRVAIPAARAVGVNGRVVAMDMQEEMLTKTKEKAEAEKLTNIEFLLTKLGEEKLQSNQFDRAILVTVLGEVPNQKGALREIFNALKPNGILSITETIFDPHYQTRNSVLRIASSIGFQERKKFGNWIAFTILLEKPSK